MPLPFALSATVEAAATVRLAPSSMSWAWTGVGLRLVLDRVGEAEAEHQLVALLGDAIADADQLEVLGEAGVHARDHVVYEAADQAVEGAVAVVIGRSLEDELAVDLLDRDLRRQGALELALRPLDLDVTRLQGDLHRARPRSRQLSNPRQLFSRLPPDVCQQLAA